MLYYLQSDHYSRFNQYFNYIILLQFDALLERLTGREMLTMYARLRGVPDDKIKGIVSDAIKLLSLEKWADSLCGNYRYSLQWALNCLFPVIPLFHIQNITDDYAAVSS